MVNQNKREVYLDFITASQALKKFLTSKHWSLSEQSTTCHRMHPDIVPTCPAPISYIIDHLQFSVLPLFLSLNNAFAPKEPRPRHFTFDKDIDVSHYKNMTLP